MTGVNMLSPMLANAIGGNVELNANRSGPSTIIRDSITIPAASTAAGSIIGLCVVEELDIIPDIKFALATALDSNGSPALTLNLGVFAIDTQGNLTSLSSTCNTLFASASTFAQSTHAVGSETIIYGTAQTAATYNQRLKDMTGWPTQLGYPEIAGFVLGLQVQTGAATGAQGVLGIQVTKINV